MISSAWPRPFLPLTVRVRTLNVPPTNSLCRVFNLTALRTARLTRPIFRPLLIFRATFNHLTFRQVWLLPCVLRVGCSTPDPPNPPPSLPVACLLTWDLLSNLLSIPRSRRFPRRSPIVATGLSMSIPPRPPYTINGLRSVGVLCAGNTFTPEYAEEPASPPCHCRFRER